MRCDAMRCGAVLRDAMQYHASGAGHLTSDDAHGDRPCPGPGSGIDADWEMIPSIAETAPNPA